MKDCALCVISHDPVLKTRGGLTVLHCVKSIFSWFLKQSDRQLVACLYDMKKQYLPIFSHLTDKEIISELKLIQISLDNTDSILNNFKKISVDSGYLRYNLIKIFFPLLKIKKSSF